MKKYFQQPAVVSKLLIALCANLLATWAVADPAAPQQQSQALYSGYSSVAIQPSNYPNIAPYQVVTLQDVYPLAVGYGLSLPVLSANRSYDAPYEFANPSPQSTAPVISTQIKDSNSNVMVEGSPSEYLLGTMLKTQLNGQQLANYSSAINDALNSLDKAGLSASQVSNGQSYNAAANIGNNAANSLIINQPYASSYDSRSLFHYVPSSQSVNSSQNPAEVYIALVGGALTPVVTPPSPAADFPVQIRRIAAIQTAGVNALQEIFNRSKPVISDTDAANLKETLNKLGDTSLKDNPVTPRDFERIMATHRLDPNNGWYAHLQQASPTELQREQLYLQAEMLYELYQIRQEEEQNKMLLAVSLLSQNYNARTGLNQQSQVAQTPVKSPAS